MNIIGEVKIKENITNFDLVNVIKTVVLFIIRKEDKQIKYTPYYREYGLITGIAKYLIDGIKFDKDDDIIDIYNKNTTISGIIDSFINEEHENMAFIEENVDDIVAFKKEKYLNDFSDIKERLIKSIEQEQALNDLNIKLAKKQNTLLSQQIKANEYNEKVMERMNPEDVAKLNEMVASGKYSMEKVAEIVTDKYINSELHKENVRSVMEAKKNKIINFSQFDDDGK